MSCLLLAATQRQKADSEQPAFVLFSEQGLKLLYFVNKAEMHISSYPCLCLCCQLDCAPLNNLESLELLQAPEPECSSHAPTFYGG